MSTRPRFECLRCGTWLATRRCAHCEGAAPGVQPLTAQTVVNFLKANKFPVLLVAEGSEDHDAIVNVSDRVYVQVGPDYLMVVRVDGEGEELAWHHYPQRSGIVAILGCDLPRALRESCTE